MNRQDWKKAEVKALLIENADDNMVVDIDPDRHRSMSRSTFYRIMRELEEDGFIYKIAPKRCHVGVPGMSNAHQRAWWANVVLCVRMRDAAQRALEETVEIMDGGR